ncbi:MAG TPA: hypothetical protein VJ716_09860 [Gaiellaceae bacterium]|nr:hypothetical protein [Gaiellaceae bacterium]
MIRMLGAQPARHGSLARRRLRFGMWRRETVLLLFGWLLFAVALGAGVLIGWAIWGH